VTTVELTPEVPRMSSVSLGRCFPESFSKETMWEIRTDSVGNADPRVNAHAGHPGLSLAHHHQHRLTCRVNKTRSD